MESFLSAPLDIGHRQMLHVFIGIESRGIGGEEFAIRDFAKELIPILGGKGFGDMPRF